LVQEKLELGLLAQQQWEWVLVQGRLPVGCPEMRLERMQRL
jgi:hypothetical protein